MSPILVRATRTVKPDLAETNAEVCGPVRQRTTSSRADRLRCRSRQALPRRPVECPDEHADGEIGPQADLALPTSMPKVPIFQLF
jgi:hypothetical protein